MARMPGAEWRPVRNFTQGGQDSVRGVVVHIMAGTLEGSQAWFNNAAAQASSHFGTGKAGALRQWVDTADRAWAQSAGNRTWLSVENEGQGGDALTDAQLDRNAQVLAWAHEKYDVPLRLATGPDDRGLGYHAMGGAGWGGHTSCPGARIVAQLPEIVARAKRLVAGETTEEDPMAGITKTDIFNAVWKTDAIAGPADAADHKTNPTWQPQSILKDVQVRVRALTVSQAAQTAAIKALAGLVGKGVDTAAVVAAVERAIESAVIDVNVNTTPEA
ncbi:N-acetylmuramoyl-L-alanine amidase [Streptomyces sp. KhCrAH-43]|uniref:peptidoglycan recognition protein family protein n=1 Tax=unclassified Streptomyces TaxID=2593676 RepID=UPI00036DEF32|nr:MULTISPECIES: peptidoglycan recognition family protein [unclassified Streptomyces]MYS34940.1 N-acetylmuramoyl-L-alanine amidase [Streptomyces sp. SID4920]MYX65283.1 N-acetylmuramoyl-L-alanine amidase [Streptomyces sp. SID8373]RAJ64745.1 N-acetylmuramoyl-L-alanine amidase [Streptomyces sp. KhCrAH-43]